MPPGSLSPISSAASLPPVAEHDGAVHLSQEPAGGSPDLLSDQQQQGQFIRGLPKTQSFTRSGSFDEVLNPNSQDHSDMLDSLATGPEQFRSEFEQICTGILPRDITDQHDHFAKRCAARAAYTLRDMYWCSTKGWLGGSLGVATGFSAVNLSNSLLCPLFRPLLMKLDWVGDTMFTRVKLQLPKQLWQGASLMTRFGRTDKESAWSYAGQVETKNAGNYKVRYKQQHGNRYEDYGPDELGQRQLLNIMYLKNDISAPVWVEGGIVDVCPAYEVVELRELSRLPNEEARNCLYGEAAQSTEKLLSHSTVATYLQPSELMKRVGNMQPGATLALERSRLQHGGVYVGVLPWLQPLLHWSLLGQFCNQVYGGGQLQSRNQQRLIVMHSHNDKMLWLALSHCNTDVHRLCLAMTWGAQTGWSSLRSHGGYRIYAMPNNHEHRTWFEKQLQHKFEQCTHVQLDSHLPHKVAWDPGQLVGQQAIVSDPWLRFPEQLPASIYLLTEGEMFGSGRATMVELLWRVVETIPMRLIKADAWVPSWSRYRQANVTGRLEKQDDVFHARCHGEQQETSHWLSLVHCQQVWSASLWEAYPARQPNERLAKALELTCNWTIGAIDSQVLQRKWLKPLQEQLGAFVPQVALSSQHQLKNIAFQVKVALNEDGIAHLLQALGEQQPCWQDWLVSTGCLVDRTRQFMRQFTRQKLAMLRHVVEHTGGATFSCGFQFPAIQEVVKQTDATWFRWYGPGVKRNWSASSVEDTRSAISALLAAKEQLFAIDDVWYHPQHRQLKMEVLARLRQFCEVNQSVLTVGSFRQYARSLTKSQPISSLQYYQQWQHWFVHQQVLQHKLAIVRSQQKHNTKFENLPLAAGLADKRAVSEHLQQEQQALQSLQQEMTEVAQVWSQTRLTPTNPTANRWSQWRTWCNFSGLKILCYIVWLRLKHVCHILATPVLSKKGS